MKQNGCRNDDRPGCLEREKYCAFGIIYKSLLHRLNIQSSVRRPYHHVAFPTYQIAIKPKKLVQRWAKLFVTDKKNIFLMHIPTVISVTFPVSDHLSAVKLCQMMHKLSGPFYKRFLARHFSVGRNDRTTCWPKPDYGPMEVMRSDLMNGIKVASAKPLGAQIGACTIMYQVLGFSIDSGKRVTLHTK